jgi:lipoprotein-anchoring transpeptidase ErfK/SrfK
MKNTSTNSTITTVASTAALTASVLAALFYFVTRSNDGTQEPPTIVTIPVKPTEVKPPEPPPAPAQDARHFLTSAAEEATQRKFADARKTLATALATNPTPTERTEILRAMIPVSEHLLKLAPDAPDVELHKVTTGERLGSLMSNYGVIMLANRMKSTNLKVGQTLRIPRGTFTIYVVKSAFRLFLMYEGAAVKEYLIAVGRGGENETPSTTFTAGNGTPDPEWYPPEALIREKGLPSVIPPNSPDNPLGTYWIPLTHDSYKGFGIHGTNDDRVLGTEATFGCIRLSNKDIDELSHVITRGMTVTIVD